MMRGRLLLTAALLLGGCVRYVGGARAVTPGQLEGTGWIRASQVEVVRQRTITDCGLAAAAMVAAHWQGPAASVEVMRRPVPPKPGLRAVEVRELLASRGLAAYVIAGRFPDLEHELRAGRPVIVGTVKPQNDGRANRHYEVVVALHPANRRVVTLDPRAGWRQWSYEAFDTEWSAARRTTIVTMKTP